MRLDVFQDNYGYWKARRGDVEVGPQRATRDEALADCEGMAQPGDVLFAEGETAGTAPPIAPPNMPGDAGFRGVGAGAGDPTGPPQVSFEDAPGALGPMVPAA